VSESINKRSVRQEVVLGLGVLEFWGLVLEKSENLRDVREVSEMPECGKPRVPYTNHEFEFYRTRFLNADRYMDGSCSKNIT